MRKAIACAVGLTLAAATPAFGSTSIGTVTPHSGADGDIAAAPIGSGSYVAVSTFGGIFGAGEIASAGGTNGSEFTTDTFSASAGDPLDFYFNYITSDGAQFADYGFAELLDGSGNHVAYLFTARTTPTGDTSPGFGLPPNDSVLTPSTSPILPGTTFSDLDATSGTCFDVGCGHTGWIESTYTIVADGNYAVRYGVTNYLDTAYDSALAFAGVTIGGNPIPIPTAPEPATWAMMIAGAGGVGMALRRRRSVVAYT